MLVLIVSSMCKFKGGGGKNFSRGGECIMVYDLAMYTVHVSIAHWIHYSSVV